MEQTTVTYDYFNRLYDYLNGDEYNNQPLTTGPLAHVPYSKQTTHEVLGVQVKKTLYEQGYAIVSLEPCTCQEKLKSWQMDLFGPVMRDVGKRHVEISTIAPEEGGKYFANSAYAQPMHTDEGHTLRFPRIATLFCAQQASSGGVSIVVPLDPLYHELRKKFGDQVELLFDQNAVNLNNIYGVESKSILLRLPEDRVGITYSGIVQGITCSTMVYEMYAFITDYVHSPRNQLRFKLKEGDLLILDNCRVMHARTRFGEGGQRKLYRMWFSEFLMV